MKAGISSKRPVPSGATVRGGKPTLGYPSRTAAVLALVDQGKTRAAIAAELGVTASTVAGLITNAGLRKGEASSARASRPVHNVGDPGGRPTAKVELNYDVARLLRPYAARRATTVPQIARELVEAALDQGLIDTMLAGRF